MTQPVLPELELILCCLRPRADRGRQRRVRELLAGRIDWTRLIELALAHGTTPLLERCFHEIDARGVPEELLDALRVQVADNARRNEVLAAALRAASQAFEAEGLAAIPCCGRPLVESAYGDATLRSAEPLDLLVPLADFSRACDLLAGHGYHALEEPRGTPANVTLLRRPADGIELRIRATLGSPPLDPAGADELWRRAEPVTLRGGRMLSFAAEDLLVVLCLRASEERWTRLASVCDIAFLLSANAPLEAANSLARAQRWSCAPCVRLGFALAHRLLAAPVSSAALEELETDPVTHREVLRLSKSLGRASPQAATANLSGRPSALREARASTYAEWSDRSAAWIAGAQARGEWETQLDRALLTAARIQPGHTVLDLASGAGNPALEIARHLGGRGCVVASDLVPAMLAGAARRAAAESLSGLRFSAAEAQGLPFRDASFDALVCRFGMMFCSRPEDALLEARRVLKPGGCAALLVWGPFEENTMFRVLYSSVAHVLGEPVVSTPLPFRFGSPDSLAAPMRSAGFTNVEERLLRFGATISADRPFWTQELEMTFGSRVTSLPTELRRRLDESIQESFGPYRTPEGYRLGSQVRLVTGACPGSIPLRPTTRKRARNSALP